MQGGPLDIFPKEKKKRKSSTRRKKSKPWTGRFLAVDGEGWDGKYTLLQMTGQEDLYRPEGLTTEDILAYLTWDERGLKSSRNAIVGYGLGYDFDNWLRDVPQRDYEDLINGAEVEYRDFVLSYIPRKMLSIRTRDLDGYEKTFTVMDTLSFFQSSFVGALEKWGIDVPQIIRDGKAAREEFGADQIDWVRQYNRWELLKLCELLEALREEDEKAFSLLGLDPRHSARIWYGPGSRAANLLDETLWLDEHPPLHLPVETPASLRPTLVPLHLVRIEAGKLAEEAKAAEGAKRDIVLELRDLGGVKVPAKTHPAYHGWHRVPAAVRRRVSARSGMALDEAAEMLGMTLAELLERLETYAPYTPDEDFEATARRALAWEDETSEWWDHMFAAAYFGGRIESAYVGECGRLYGYDLNSAYPYAITHLPWWEPGDLVWVEGLDPEMRMGMYYVRWRLAPGANFYPFPWRSRSGNVFFPPAGEGWVMSPEVYAALLHWPEGIEVVGGLVLQHTEGAGDGIGFPAQRASTGVVLEEMARQRLEAKARGERHEKALKLVMNSVYGKTIQQVGSHKYLSTFAASWITSTCRALIYRAVGPDWDKQVIGIMTDGMYTRRELDVEEGPWLGQWERTEYDEGLFLLPGVYRLRKNGKEVRKYRGVSSDIDYDAALRAWRQGEKYPTKVRIYVTRAMAIHQPNAYGDKAHRFVEIERAEDFSLKSKRQVEGVDRGERLAWHPPKHATLGEMSTPYMLRLDPAELTLDEADDLDQAYFDALLDQDLFGCQP